MGKLYLTLGKNTPKTYVQQQNTVARQHKYLLLLPRLIGETSSPGNKISLVDVVAYCTSTVRLPLLLSSSLDIRLGKEAGQPDRSAIHIRSAKIIPPVSASTIHLIPSRHMFVCFLLFFYTS